MTDCLAQLDSCHAQAAREGWLDVSGSLKDVRDLLDVVIRDLRTRESKEHGRIVEIGEFVMHGTIKYLVESIHWQNEEGRWSSISRLQQVGKPSNVLSMPTSAVARLKVVST